MFNKSGLQDKVVIVTGGAKGIGRSIVEFLAQQGARIHFFYHQSKENAQSLLELSEQEQWCVEAYQVDIRNKAQCNEAIETIHNKSERIDVLVNNSGVIRDNLLVALEDQDIQAVIDTNLRGVFHMTQAVVPYMMSKRAGKIINISSVSAEKGGRGQSNYAATKGAINSFTKAMANDDAIDRRSILSIYCR